VEAFVRPIGEVEFGLHHHPLADLPHAPRTILGDLLGPLVEIDRVLDHTQIIVRVLKFLIGGLHGYGHLVASRPDVCKRVDARAVDATGEHLPVVRLAGPGLALDPPAQVVQRIAVPAPLHLRAEIPRFGKDGVHVADQHRKVAGCHG